MPAGEILHELRIGELAAHRTHPAHAYYGTVGREPAF